jgi:tetratricopeptide (TPR) repeat protein
MDLKKHNKGNVTKDFIESTIARIRKKLLFWGSAVSSTQKKIFVWGSAVTLAVIVMVLTGPSNKRISSEENRQKPASASVLSVSAAQNDKSKTNKPIVLEVAKEELNNKNYIRAVELFEDIMDRNPANMPEVKVYYSQALRGQAGSVLEENLSKAEILLRKALVADPQNAEAYFDLGRLYTKSKDYSKAIKAYQKAADFNYRTPDTFFNLGFIYATKEDYMNAEKMFLLVADSRTDYLDKALFNLAVVQQKQGKRNQCIENLEKALMINPKNQRIQKYLNRFKSNS